MSLSYNKTDVLKEENLIKKIKEKKKGKFGHKETHLLGEDGGRDWKDASTSQVMPANTKSRREA